ncbi:Cysteine-rich RLK (RECEPTOR-like protein kinase) 8 [Cucumis melo var. makuwa]|uniref:Cysteine-rich RLK (RECEPTOR-like protein kinase) 8 n=1 Tax=Cucumis melo var. makuwa TaxID=1194695 RepID=A0A5A7U7G0_CUCMM|nr:Cysteine-rich RLK (RECEPTOR-like protein kinase) 8 [Cucumis melo var. makuwa]TYK28097.1 Cysteine-rich RLK (RECEPTOR-like protein kinase) 8 [Cucumis melo var. makuwa]
MLPTSLPSYLWGDAILTATHLINRMPSRILHLQTPLDCLKEFYPSTRLVSEVPLRMLVCLLDIPYTNADINVFTRRPGNTLSLWMLLSVRTDPTFPLAIFRGRVRVNSLTALSNLLNLLLVPRNLKKEVGSPTSQLSAPVQDFEPPRDQGMENPTEPCTNNTMSENDKSDVAVLENMGENNCGDEIEVRIEIINDEAEQGHTRKLDEYDPSLDIPIALKKGYKWVLSLKYKADGTLDRHKARLVKKGFTQTYGINCSETVSPVAKLNTIRVFLSVVVNKDWPLYQLDVKNAFLNGDLVEEVYMSPRQDLKPNLVSRFTTFVKSQGYSQEHSDHTLFTKVSKTGKIAILIVYVDDIVLTRDDQTETNKLKQRMGDEFEIKELGNLKYFLGMEVARSKEGISVS